LLLPLVLALHLSVPTLRLPDSASPRLQLARFPAPTLAQLMDLQLPAPAALPVDPFKDSLRFGEVMGGAGTSLLTSVAGYAAGALVVVLLASNTGQDLPPGVIAAIAVYVAIQVFALPPLVALAEYAISDGPLAGSLTRAVGYAYAAQGVAVGTLILGIVLSSALSSGALSFLTVVGFAALELVAIPIAASWGLHGGENAGGPGEAVRPVPSLPPENTPPGLEAPPLVPGSLPTLPPTALNFTFRF
jgi:hypothetical protein